MAEASATPGGVPRLRPPTPRAALAIGAVLAVLAILYLGREALTPFLLGLLLVYLLAPAGACPSTPVPETPAPAPVGPSGPGVDATGTP